MAVLKSLRMKEKTFVFKSYGNDQEEIPAKIIFNRFPVNGETFTSVDKKDIFDGIDVTNVSKRELQAKIADKIVDSFLHNMRAGNTDYQRFFKECVDRFEDLQFEQSKIVTVSDFWQILPIDAAITIAQEALEYASERDEFTMGNSNA